MYYYQVLPIRKLPNPILTYVFPNKIPVGQWVEVPIQSKIVEAIILSEISENAIEYSKDKIKEVNNIKPVQLNSQTIEFLKVFSQNTFNSLNLSLASFWQPYKLLTKKQWSQLDSNARKNLDAIPKNNTSQAEISDSAPKPQTQSQTQAGLTDIGSKIEYYLDLDITIRIMYLIRTKIDNLSNINKYDKIEQSRQILLLFPEKKYLQKVYNEIIELPEWKRLLQSHTMTVEIFTGDNNKQSKKVVWDLIGADQDNLQPKNPVQIIFATRSGIFLPFNDLTQINLVDESNSFHIQDQNRIYFDSRDTAFLMSKIYNADLNFISVIPSVRLHNFYSEKVLNNIKSNKLQTNLKPPKIEISELNQKTAHFELFSTAVEDVLRRGEVESGMYFEGNDDEALI